jgi:hypothetical protein
MKKPLHAIIIIAIILLLNLVMKAQVSAPFNFGAVGNYVGWNAAQAFPLTIQHLGPQPINFLTAGNPIPRMTIRGQAGPTQGFIGVNQANPQSRFTVNGNMTIGSNVSAPANGLRVFGRTYMGGNGNPPQGILHIDNNSLAFQLVLESTNPFNPDMTFADNTGVKGQIRYTMGSVPTTFRGLAFSADDANNTWLGIINTQIFINGVSTRIGLGNNVYDPQNRVEINSDPSDPEPAGLRFTNLLSTATPVANPGLGVLSVDNDGDVIYVNPFGASCGATNPYNLSGDWRVGLNAFNFYYDGNGTGTQQNNVIIGKNCTTPILGKLDVLQASASTTGSVGIYVENQDLSASGLGQEIIGLKSFIPFVTNPTAGIQIAVQGIASGEKFNIAVDGLSNSTGSNVFNTGGRFTAISTTGITNTGVATIAQDGQTNTGISIGAFNGTTAQGININAIGATLNNTGINIAANGGTVNNGVSSDVNSAGTTNTGIGSRTQGGTTNYAGRFTAPGFTGTNYGVYASAQAGLTNFAGYFNGDVYVNGGANSGTGFLIASDAQFKTNIDTIQNALQTISQLQPKEFYFDTTNAYDMRFSSKKQYGVIAQEVYAVMPELVGTSIKPAEYDSLGNIIYPSVTFKTVNYNAFIAILIKGMQEQESKIDSLTQQMSTMQSQINNCCASNSRTQNTSLNQTDVTLTNSESIGLDQNIPNPFAEQTTITYNLPQSVVKAQLLFYDANGKLIKAVDLTERGKGQINVFANDLSNGIYSYALVVDGQIIDTKRMVKTE